MISTKCTRPLKLMRRLTGVKHLLEMQGYSYDNVPVDHPYSIATHYFTVEDEDDENIVAKLANPNIVSVTKVQRPLGKSVVETFFFIGNQEKIEEWYLVTDWAHSKPKDWWGRPRKNAYRHLKTGEMIYYVCKQSMPDRKFKLTPFRDDWGF